MDGTEAPARAKVGMIVRMVVLLAVFQLARWAFESLVFLAVPHTLLSNELVRILSYVLMFVALLAWSRHVRVRLHLLPGRLSAGYIILLAIFILLFCLTLSLDGQYREGLVWATLICGTIATPLLEEPLFRGYVWERLGAVFSKGWQVVFISALLFGLWHLGYTDAILWRVAQPDMVDVTFWATMGPKMVAAVILGAVFGILRMRWGNCLPSGILHAIWNTLA